MTPPDLEIRNLSCQRGERRLFSDVNLSISSGQIVHIAGPNGCGKSSLLRQICGLSSYESGEIIWRNQSISNNDNFKHCLAYIGHKDGLKKELSAFENLQFYQSMNARADADKVDDVLSQMGILHCAELSTHQLSFGQRRRLAFARLLLHFTPIWVLDEPFTGIDHSGRDVLTELFLAHIKKAGMIILTNHGELTLSDHKHALKVVDLREFQTPDATNLI